MRSVVFCHGCVLGGKSDLQLLSCIIYYIREDAIGGGSGGQGGGKYILPPPNVGLVHRACKWMESETISFYVSETLAW